LLAPIEAPHEERADEVADLGGEEKAENKERENVHDANHLCFGGYKVVLVEIASRAFFIHKDGLMAERLAHGRRQ